MPKRLPDDRLLRISQAKKPLLANWREGADLETKAGKRIHELQLLAVVDRWKLSQEHRRHANVVLARKPPLYRAAISRYYYAMYHGMRAAAYLFHGGDDHQEHKELPQHTPTDFPNAPVWQNSLKNARELRNQADYDPYPRSDKFWRPVAQALKTDTDNFLFDLRNYLTRKGCVLP